MKHSLKPCANGRNIVGQQLPKLLHVTCCLRSAHPVACCCVLLRVVAQPVKPLATWKRTQQLPLANNVVSVCPGLKPQ